MPENGIIANKKDNQILKNNAKSVVVVGAFWVFDIEIAKILDI